MRSPALGGQGDTAPVGPFLASDNGLLAALNDPLLNFNSYQPTAGALWLIRLKMQTTSVVTNIVTSVKTAGDAAMTNCAVGVYSIAAGTATLIGSSADLSVNWHTNGDKIHPLTVPTASQPAGTVLLVAGLVGAATTIPAFRAMQLGNPNNNLVAASPYRVGAYGSALTALPASFALSATTTGGFPVWFGLS